MSYNELKNTESINRTAENLKNHNFEPIIVQNKEEALTKIKELIPAGASVMNGASKTLETIGYIEYLKSGQHGWNNLHEKVLAETNPVKQAQLRRESVLSDYYLGSVHALTETGEMIIASNTGSQMPHIVFTSPNLIFVVGAQKIVSDVNDGLKRINEYVLALEDARMKEVYGYGTQHNKTLILHGENPNLKRKVRVIIVNERLGF